MKLNYINSLRGIAILMVILTHTAQGFKNLGNNADLFCSYMEVGVQLFFVLSAFTLCLSSESRRSEIDENKLKSFYLRRFFRIAPLYYLGIPVYFFYTILWNHYLTGIYSYPVQYSFLNVLSNILFLHGFYPKGINSIVYGGWSIGTEMAFYLIFPALFAFYSKIRLSVYKLITVPIVSLLFSIVFSLSINYVFGIIPSNNTFFYYNLINQLPVFLIGMSLYFYVTSVKQKVFSIRTLSLLFTISFCISLVVFKFYLNIAVVPFVAGLNFLLLFLLFERINFSNKLLNKIGDLSFSIYLFHFIFAGLVSKYIDSYLHGYVPPIISLSICLLTTIISSILVASLSRKFIEKPGIAFGNALIREMNAKVGDKIYH